MIFDTDILIWFFRGDLGAEEFIRIESERSISIVSLMEFIQGVRSQSEVKQIRGFLVDNEIHILPISEPVSYLAATLVEDYTRSHGLGVSDALIAATAREQGATLATANIRYFRFISKLQLKKFRPSKS